MIRFAFKLALLGILSAGIVIAWIFWLRPGGPAFLTDDLSVCAEQACLERAAQALNQGVAVGGFHASVRAIEPGENFWTVARDQKVDIDTVIGANPWLKDLKAGTGQALLLVNRKGCVHQARLGETIGSIAVLYRVPVEKIRSANRLPFGSLEGLLLFMPGAKPRILNPSLKELFRLRAMFRSPLSGRYTSLMGLRSDPFTGFSKKHNGVDIKAPLGEAVGAASGGRVSFAGTKDGYGKCIIIRHNRLYQTLYGHLGKIAVKTGQKVRRGQLIGSVGMTGRTTGPHLHFTILYKDTSQDPLKYLW